MVYENLESTISFVMDDKIGNYKIEPPFNPPSQFPELSRFNFELDPHNKIYEAIRNSIILLGLDKQNIGTSNWNPFSQFIKKGNNVLIKPNFVKDFHPLGIQGVISQITNASILRPIIDYVLLALDFKGRIIIADTPLEKADFSRILEITHTNKLIEFYDKILKTQIEIYDMRSYKRKKTKTGSFLLKKESLVGPPGGFIMVDLGPQSEFDSLDSYNPNYYTLADYSIDRTNPRSQKYSETNLYHKKNKHVYKIPRLLLESDVVISVPKLKTHRMAGITVNLKNIIGICDKIYMPHYRQGSPPRGDAVPELPPMKDIVKKKIRAKDRFIMKDFASYVRDFPLINKILRPFYHFYLKSLRVSGHWFGEWSGNDTLWRTILDLNKIVIYADQNGKLRNDPQRNYFSVVDGIISQEGEGPMTGYPRSLGIILAGFDPVAIDAYSAWIMGYDINKLKIIKGAGNLKMHYLGNNNLDRIKISSNLSDPLDINLNFKLPRGYIDTKRF